KTVVLEPVGEPAEAAITRCVAVLRTLLEHLERCLQESWAKVPRHSREACTTCDCIVQVDLHFRPRLPFRCERGAVLCLNLALLDLEFLSGGLGKCFADRTKGDVST